MRIKGDIDLMRVPLALMLPLGSNPGTSVFYVTERNMLLPILGRSLLYSKERICLNNVFNTYDPFYQID
jgi:hypothetical protein